MKRTFTTAALLFAALHAPAQIPASAGNDAHNGRVDKALAALAGQKNPEADALRCQLYGSIEERDLAIQACEAATGSVPSNSEYALLLARAYGDKADHSSALTGLRMVGKIRGSFEHAVQLDPNNVEALSDLGEFYVEAPGMVGGSVAKAAELVTRLQPLSPVRSRRLSAMIAAKNHDTGNAEAEYNAVIESSHTPESYVDLAKFYRDQKRFDAAETAARQAIGADKQHGPDSLDASTLLLGMRRGISTAQAALRNYLSTPQKGVAYFAHAHVLLGDSLKAAGDNTGAQTEYAAALSLAKDYKPARKAAGR